MHYCLTLSYDHLQCWLRSVDEARNILSTQEAHLRSTSSRFFSLFWLTTDLVVALSVSSSQPSTTSMQTSASSGRTNTTTTMTDFSDDTNSYTSKTPISHDIGDFIELPLADSSSISSSDSSLG